MSRYPVIALGLALGFATLAGAPAVAQNNALQADEIAYCNKLRGIYERYMPMRSYGGAMGSSPSAETHTALTMCNNGRHAEAIPHLEKVLRGNGFRLPERAVGTRNP